MAGLTTPWLTVGSCGTDHDDAHAPPFSELHWCPRVWFDQRFLEATEALTPSPIPVQWTCEGNKVTAFCEKRGSKAVWILTEETNKHGQTLGKWPD